MLPNSQGEAGDRGAVHPHVKKRRRRRRNGEEDEPVLRTTCDNCTGAKVKCNGETPCVRCKNKNIRCEYTFKKRCGPKRRKGIDGAGGRDAGEGEGLLAPYTSGMRGGTGIPGFDKHLSGIAVVLGKEEVECIRVFMQNLNSFLPLTTFDTVKQAAAPPGQGTESADDSQNEERGQLNHARKALLHGAIAVGAEFLEKEEASVAHAMIARGEIKECFDAAVPELVGAYLILALYWIHQMDSSKIARYVGLAHQSNGIICEPPKELVASLRFISVVLYDSRVLPSVGCGVAPPGSTVKPRSPSLNTPVACQERVLNILSWVLLSIHNRVKPCRGSAISTGEWDPNALARNLDEAISLLDNRPSSNDMSRCIVGVLKAYFFLLKDDRRRAVMLTEPIADLVSDNPLVLRLPIVWSLMACVRALLRTANRTIAAERLQCAMEPLAPHLGSSSEESVVVQELLRVFNKQKRGERGPGGASSLAAEGNMLIRQGAQTSSLNVTAGDVMHERLPLDLLSIEPSTAPRRRGMPSSSSRQTPSGAGGRGDAGALSPSLLSAAAGMASSGSSALVSPSRAGVLSRQPVQAPYPFERAPASLLQLDIPYTREFTPDPVPGEVVPPTRSSDVGVPGIVPLRTSPSRSSPTVTEDEVEIAEGVGGAVGANDEELLEGTEARFMSHDRTELMSRQQIQPSFKADAPVSLEQVESTMASMAKLGVSSAEDNEASSLNRVMASMDLDAAAEQLLATKSSFIS